MTELVRAAALLTGENLSIETLPPLTPRPRVEEDDPAATRATGAPVVVAAVNATLGASTGQPSQTTPPWRGGMIAGGLALVLIGAVAFVTMRVGSKTVEPDAAPIAPVTTPVPPADASVAAVLHDADTPDAIRSVSRNTSSKRSTPTATARPSPKPTASARPAVSARPAASAKPTTRPPDPATSPKPVSSPKPTALPAASPRPAAGSAGSGSTSTDPELENR
jgi:hypothetical protein